MISHSDEELSFLDNIFAEPEELSLRSVYADWLEERGDPRAELLRLRLEVESGDEGLALRMESTEREREILSDCSDDWVVLLDRAEWKRLYLSIEPSARHADRWTPERQRAIGRALDGFEAEFSTILPRSFKAFAHVFGKGELAGYFRFLAPCEEDSYDITIENRMVREIDHFGNGWPNAVVLGSTIGGEYVVLDTSSVSDERSRDSQIHWLTRDLQVDKSASSFPEFVENVCFTVFDDEGEPTPREFMAYKSEWVERHAPVGRVAGIAGPLVGGPR